jgi:hypothetical protein
MTDTISDAILRVINEKEDALQSGLKYVLAEALAEICVPRDVHEAAVGSANAYQRRWFDKAEAAEKRALRAERIASQLDPERIGRVFRDLEQVPSQRSAKHDTDCWQRHAGCLGARVRSLLATGEVR